MRIFNIIWAILFLGFAALQLNDPDPWVWIPLYLAAAALCGLRYAGKARVHLERWAIITYAAYALFLLFTKDGVLDWYEDHQAENLVQTMKATKPWVENTREFGGLLIMSLILAINIRTDSRKTS